MSTFSGVYDRLGHQRVNDIDFKEKGYILGCIVKKQGRGEDRLHHGINKSPSSLKK